MWLNVKVRLQCLWAVKSQDEQKQIAIKIISGLVAGAISLMLAASRLDFGYLFNIIKLHYLPVALAAIKNNRWELAGAFITAVASGILFHQSLVLARTRSQVWFDKRLPLEQFNDDNLSENDLLSGYRTYRPVLQDKGLAIYSPQINQTLRNIDQLPFDSGVPWKLRGMGSELLPFAIFRASSKGIAFDAPKVRLGTDILLKNGRLPDRLSIQKTRYFSGLATNDLSYIEISSRPIADLYCPFRPLYDGTVMFLEPASRSSPQILRPLEGSPCSNHIGVSTLAITRDKVAILTGQSSTNIQSRRLLAPSGSGSVDWRDIRKRDDFLGVIRNAAERELIEECGLKRGQYALQTFVIGFARLVHRGGKPEFFCLTTINKNSGDIELLHSQNEKFFTAYNHSDQMYGAIDLSPTMIESSVREFCTRNKEISSILLELSLRFISEAIIENPKILDLPINSHH